MLHILTIIGWIMAIGCMLYLAKEMLKDRFHVRSARKLAIRNALRAKRRERFIENRRYLMRQAGHTVPPRSDVVQVDRKQTQKLFGWVALILWQAYWIIEIADQFKKGDRPLQLPYFFLFIVMVAIPYSIYWFARRRRRRPIEL
jgi:hypothetical protein